MHNHNPGNFSTESLKSILSTLVYFNIFNHPLTASEISEFAHHLPNNPQTLKNDLEFLVEQELIYNHKGYYLINDEFENVERRKSGSSMAEKTWPKAFSQSVLISKFPYVRSVVISGSLSKGFMDENSDIDFLIITEPGRLWITRSLLALYKKLFLFNSHKYFCVNYFLDTNNLTLPDKNIFIATELMFAVPVYNPDVHRNFLESNKWAMKYYPSKKMDIPFDPEKFPPPPVSKKIAEKILGGWPGKMLDKLLMKITIGFWQKKFRTMKKKQYERDMKSDAGVAKHHPNGFRDRVLQEYEENYNQILIKLNACKQNSPIN